MGLFYTVLLSSKRQTTLIAFSPQSSSPRNGGEGCAWTKTHHDLPLGVIPTPLPLSEPKQAEQKHSDLHPS